MKWCSSSVSSGGQSPGIVSVGGLHGYSSAIAVGPARQVRVVPEAVGVVGEVGRKRFDARLRGVGC